MRTRSDYRICPFCGSTLDVSERCDCYEESSGYQDDRLAYSDYLLGRKRSYAEKRATA